MVDEFRCIQITSASVYYVILLFNGPQPAIHGIMVNDELGKLEETDIIWRSAVAFPTGLVDTEYKPVQALLYWLLM